MPIIRPRRSKSPEEIAFERGELPVSEVVYTHADAESGGQVTASIRGFVVGSLLWDWRNGVPMLSTVSVVRQYQRKGIATGLVVHLAEHLQRHDFTYAHLTADGAALQKDLSKRGRRNNGSQDSGTRYSDMKLVQHDEVYHFGNLAATRRKAHASLEGPGLSVSVHPVAWRTIARGGGTQLYALERLDHTAGRFADLTDDSTRETLLESAVDAGLLKPATLYRVWTADEDGLRYMVFSAKNQAQREYDDVAEFDEEARLEEVRGYVATPKLRRWYARIFTGTLDPLLAVDMALLYVLETSSDVDGAWWNEELDPAALSAPRGVIFQTKLPEWGVYPIAWDEAPDANIFDGD